METSPCRRIALAWIVVGLALSGCGPSPKPQAPESETPSGGGSETTDASSPSEDSTATATSDDAEIRQAIDRFLKDPSNGDVNKIMGFVRDSPKVLVVYRRSLLESADASKDLGALMMAAFAAGNVAAQLDAGKKEDMPVAGVRAMVAVYRKVQAANASIKASTYEDFATRLDKGTLDAHVKELVAKEIAEHGK